MKRADFDNHVTDLPKPMMGEANGDGKKLDPDTTWRSAKETIRLALKDKREFSIFRNCYIESINNGVAMFSCDKEFKKDKIVREYSQVIKDALKNSTGQNLEIEFNIREVKSKDKYEYYNPQEKVSVNTDSPSATLFTEVEEQTKQREIALKNSQLNPKYLFENFIIGSSNRLAEAVAQAVVNDAGNEYNPLFYYGPTGVGKTHLMQAIGNEILKKDPSKKVVYVSIEQFLNEMIESIRSKKNTEFRNKYRMVDLLIIDDVQFVETYPKTQEELFHTFNSLYQANKQIILASDRSPSEIKNITDRLRSRFKGGMVADIQAPDYETRMAILQQVLEEKDTDVPHEYLDLIAKNVENSIRELEGSLTKVISLINLGVNPSFDDVAKLLQIDIESKRKKITPTKVIKTVSEVFDVKPVDIKGGRRTAYVAQCRQTVMYILRKELDLPLERVAQEVNRKDHTTVLHACKKIEALTIKEPRFNEKLDKCMRILKS